MTILRYIPCDCMVCYRPGTRGHLIVTIGGRTLPVRRCPHCRFDITRHNPQWWAIDRDGTVHEFGSRSELNKFLKSPAPGNQGR